MRALLFSAAIAVAALGCDKSKSNHDTSEAEYNLAELSVDEVAAGLAAKQLTVVDCNMESTRKDKGVIPGAILVAESETYPATVLPADKTTKLVFYCGGPG